MLSQIWQIGHSKNYTQNDFENAHPTAMAILAI